MQQYEDQAYGAEVEMKKPSVAEMQLNEIELSIDVLREKLALVLKESEPSNKKEVIHQTPLERRIASIQYALADLIDRVSL